MSFWEFLGLLILLPVGGWFFLCAATFVLSLAAGGSALAGGLLRAIRKARR